jgi:hypothetical protein
VRMKFGTEAEEESPTFEIVLSRGRLSLGCGGDAAGDTFEFVFGGLWSLEEGFVPKRSRKVGIMGLVQR